MSPRETITADELPSFDMGGIAADEHDELAARAALEDLEESS